MSILEPSDGKPSYHNEWGEKLEGGGSSLIFQQEMKDNEAKIFLFEMDIAINTSTATVRNGHIAKNHQ